MFLMTTEKAREGHYQTRLKISSEAIFTPGSLVPKASIKLIAKVAPEFLTYRMKSRCNLKFNWFIMMFC